MGKRQDAASTIAGESGIRIKPCRAASNVAWEFRIMRRGCPQHFKTTERSRARWYRHSWIRHSWFRRN